jgi:hypothetical protein
MEDSHRLETLCRKNAERWSTLKELHQKQCDVAASMAPTAENQSAAFTAELKMLQSATSSRPHVHVDFSAELVNSHDELKHTNAVVEQHKERQQQKLREMKQMNDQYKSVNGALVLMQSSNAHPQRDDQSSSSSSSSEDNLQRENRWIRQELKYVAQKLELCANNKRRRLESSDQSSNAAKNDARWKENNKRTWSLDHFLLKLTECYLASDPYVLVSSLPVEPWQVDFLRECHVIRIHPDNPNLVCLSDYNGS